MSPEDRQTEWKRLEAALVKALADLQDFTGMGGFVLKDEGSGMVVLFGPEEVLPAMLKGLEAVNMKDVPVVQNVPLPAKPKEKREPILDGSNVVPLRPKA